jgi:hypothetical protein
MRWLLMGFAVFCVVASILFATYSELIAAGELQGHRFGGIAAGIGALAVIFIIAVGVAMFLSR